MNKKNIWSGFLLLGLVPLLAVFVNGFLLHNQGWNHDNLNTITDALTTASLIGAVASLVFGGKNRNLYLVIFSVLLLIIDLTIILLVHAVSNFGF